MNESSVRFQISVCLAALVLTIAAEEKRTNTVSVSASPTVTKGHTVNKLVKVLEKYGLEEQRSLKKVYLSNRSITCNDGSQAGFYLRKSHGSQRWIIYLEGGWYCYDHKSCRNRWLRLRHLMTSTQWPETRDVGGLLSSNPEENPYWWNANHVFVPYCTSDSWSGTRSSANDMFSFMGAEIVTQVIRDLVPLGLENASSLLMAGSSAGGTGVMLNLDHVRNLIHYKLGLRFVDIRGVSDSGWFLDRAPYSSNGLSSVDAVRKGMEFWKARMPDNCVAKYPTEPWRCYFGYRLYPTLTVPLFVFQWLFDEAQMSADNVGAPVTKQQWDYIHKMGDSLRQTFENVTAVFAPSCISHSILTKRDWQLVKIDEVSLSQALYCWEQMSSDPRNDTRSRIETNQPCAKSMRKLLRSGLTKGNGTPFELGRNRKHEPAVKFQRVGSALINKLNAGKTLQSTILTENKKRKRRKHKGRRRERNKGTRIKKNHERKKVAGRRKGNKQNNENNHTGMFNGTRPQRSVIPSGKRRCVQGCHFRLIERCTWPQCNHSCPKLHNPFTGEEMDFIELLKSFGLDMKSVANALGIDIQTLNTMDHEELLNLLTQRAN
ncbi:palmitoleoyl-protein carboxylesterase NOTUM [Ceratina calcarata]|uniref:Palmitoleoyl-protein carboxylesterase NOTUM n=1 Tax=Ceratina calcarata TaxID=156304 RepID=A0AAJ7WC59_9HYME|nr:palmitoleoyl-protein carboxylesterase NOTUM [Ceratina calcarata]